MTGLERPRATDEHGNTTRKAAIGGTSTTYGLGGEWSDAEIELLVAVARYRQVNGVSYVAPSDVLWILTQLGYRKVEKSMVTI